ncbi:MAG: MADS box protein [Amphiamblys sp. WSBS2006]|nr:MAG: MADS box protein [Amphiamblys sp. WSBS2006]
MTNKLADGRSENTCGKDAQIGGGSDALPAEETFVDPSETENEHTSQPTTPRRSRKRKINIEYLEDKGKRHITFSKRKAGIMKKAHELAVLTGTQVLVLVASETGNVYTYSSQKFQPMITRPEGKELIKKCLSAEIHKKASPVKPKKLHKEAGARPENAYDENEDPIAILRNINKTKTLEDFRASPFPDTLDDDVDFIFRK